MRTLFSLLDEDENGSLDFREFLVGLALLTEGGVDARLKLAFDMFDKHGEGLVQLADLKRVFRRAFPDVGEQQVHEAFADVYQASVQAKNQPMQTPGGSDTVAINFAQFKDFCAQVSLVCTGNEVQ